jgi:hypothetical protein
VSQLVLDVYIYPLTFANVPIFHKISSTNTIRMLWILARRDTNHTQITGECTRLYLPDLFLHVVYISLNKASYCGLEPCVTYGPSLVYFGTTSLQKWQKPPTPIGCTDHLSVYLWIRVNREIPSESPVPEVQTSHHRIRFSHIIIWVTQQVREEINKKRQKISSPCPQLGQCNDVCASRGLTGTWVSGTLINYVTMREKRQSTTCPIMCYY